MLLSLLVGCAITGQDFPDGPALPARPYFVLLNKGAANLPPLTPEQSREAMSKHLGNFDRLFGEGKLLLAGPWTDNGFTRGIVVVLARRSSDLKKYFAPDPLISQGRLSVEAHEMECDLGRFDTSNPNAPMIQNTVVLLKRGPSWGRPQPVTRGYRLLPSLADWMRDGSLAFWGQFKSNTDKLGVLYFHSSDSKAVAARVGADPLVQGGFVTAETHPQFMADFFRGRPKP